MRHKTSPLLERRAEPPEYPANKYGPRPRRPSSRVVLNVRLLVISVVVLAILIPSAIFWHGYQTRRNRDVFLATAAEAEAKAAAAQDEKVRKKHWKEAAKHLVRYLHLDPNSEENLEAKIRLAIATDEGAQTSRDIYQASERYLDVIGLVEDSKELQNRRGLLLVTQPYFADFYAEAINRFRHLREEKNGPKSNPTGWMILQIAEYRQARVKGDKPSDRVLEGLAQIKDYPITDIRLATLYTAICFELEAQKSGSHWGELSDLALDQMVEANPDEYRAYLSRFSYRFSRDALNAGEITGDKELTKQFKGDLEKALELAPDQAEVLLAAGQFALATQQYGEARKYFTQLVEKNPDDRRGYVVLGNTHAQNNEPTEAINVWRKGLQLRDFEDADGWNLHLQLANQLYQTLMAQKRPDEGSRVLDELGEDYKRAKYLLDEAQQTEFLAFLDMRRAQIAVEHSEYRKAVPLLESVLVARRPPDNAGQLRERLWTLATLGESYAKLGQHDQAAQYFNEARDVHSRLAKVQGGSHPANGTSAGAQLPPQYQIASADSLLNGERYDEAIRAYERIKSDLRKMLRDRSASEPVLKKSLEDVLSKLALAHYRRQVLAPPAERQWEDVQKAVNEALDHNPESLQAGLLAVQLNATRGDKESALQALKELESKHPNAPQMWQSALVVYEAWGEPGQADRKVEEFASRAQDPNAAVELRVALLTQRRQWDQAKELLKRDYQTETARDRARLEVKLANLELSTGSFELAKDRYERLFSEMSESLGTEQQIALLRSLIQMSLADPERDSKTIQGYIDRLKAVEGAENGTWWRLYEATHWISERENVSPETLRQVEAHQKFIESRRPRWPAVYVLKAQIAVHRENLEEATDHCKSAIRLGDHSFGTYRMLIQLLGKQQRVDELDTYLARMGDSVLFERDLTTFAISRFADSAIDSSGGIDQARLKQTLYFARRNVQLRPKDYLARLWLGQSLIMAGEMEEAEAVFREAVDLWPDQPVTWIGLVGFYFNENRQDEALAELGRFEATPVPEAQRVEKHFTLARGYEQGGNAERAKHHYYEALELAPNNESVLARASNYLLKSDPPAAILLLRRLVAISKNPTPAQQNLAMLLASRGGERAWREALRIIDSLLQEAKGAEVPLNRRIKAMILTQRNTLDNRNQAIDLLEQVVTHSSATAVDQLRLASLYEQQDQLSKASDVVTNVANREDLNQEQLAAVVDFYLRNNEQLSAGKALQALAVQAPNELVTLQLEARLLEKKGRGSEVPDLVKAFVDRRLPELVQTRRQVELLLGAANVCASVDHKDPAEQYYRRAMQIDRSSAQHLAVWLALQNRHEEALDLAIQRHEAEQSPESLTAILRLLTVENPAEETFQRVRPYLAEAEEKYQDDVAMLTVVATVRYKEQRFDESLKHYLRVIELDEDNLVALNNAAWMLAERGEDPDRGLEFIERAIDRYGPNLQLRDTRGMVQFFRQNLLAAVIDLQAVVLEQSAEAQHYFHYALALQKSGKTDEARASLETARSNGLSRQTLTSVEQNLLDELEKNLGT